MHQIDLTTNLFSKNRHDWTQITQAGELQAQKSPRGEGWGLFLVFGIIVFF